jgi:hypothetical protein
LKWVWLADATDELGISADALADRLTAGEFEPIGSGYGDGLPTPIPPEHFAVPLRETRNAGPEDVAALVQLGYEIPNGYASPIDWVDSDPDERTGSVWNVRPATCLDIEGCAIYEGGEPRWTDIRVKLLRESSQTRPKKMVSLEVYTNYQGANEEGDR